MRAKPNGAWCLTALVSVLATAPGCGGDDADDGGSGGGGDASELDAPQDARSPTDSGQTSPGSIRFYGTGKSGIDRAEVRLDPHVPADVGSGDLTIELWFRRDPLAPLVQGSCAANANGWVAGNVILDRDRRDTAVHGEFGLSLVGGRLAFGLSKGAQGVGLCGTHDVATGWHHVAVTRNGSSGAIVMYFDGQVDAMASGPAGDISYQDGATGDVKDPFLTIGAEKFDLGGTHPAFSGWVDELRLSTSIRYTEAFTNPLEPFVVDADTAALYHFDEGDGDAVGDARGMSPGLVRVGLDDNGSTVPAWAVATPFLQ